ncbi:tetratricopeptide repeat protein [Marinimicrobium agarilyticum]|uniref:tetratricopeptide repeat protein n=1 Tax=Marinimicrobium agarilyticum TaxID=306546 RepID=UPI0004052E2E|nr:tetratricopeptide repeat protein [Marinimicrobium agarilyticum]
MKRWSKQQYGALTLALLIGWSTHSPGAPRDALSERVADIRAAVEAGDWASVQKTLPTLSQHYALSETQRLYLRLVQGLNWQRQGQHRRAIEVYEAFQPGEPYYAEARTNLAIAYLKQDWWSDAQRELMQLLTEDIDAESKNRLRMMLGLSQLQQGFYRDARETFGTLDQDSRYAAFAWRGIGLSALHLQDYTGALNAFLQLKALNHPALPDGPFLVAFTYDQMNRLTLAQASYQEALLHYQAKLQTIDRQLEDNPSNQALKERREQIHTYLSQSQYGLATIYDRQ